MWNKHSRLVLLLMGSVSFGSGTENEKGKEREVEMTWLFPVQGETVYTLRRVRRNEARQEFV